MVVMLSVPADSSRSVTSTLRFAARDQQTLLLQCHSKRPLRRRDLRHQSPKASLSGSSRGVSPDSIRSARAAAVPCALTMLLSFWRWRYDAVLANVNATRKGETNARQMTVLPSLLHSWERCTGAAHCFICARLAEALGLEHSPIQCSPRRTCTYTESPIHSNTSHQARAKHAPGNRESDQIRYDC